MSTCDNVNLLLDAMPEKNVFNDMWSTGVSKYPQSRSGLYTLMAYAQLIFARLIINLDHITTRTLLPSVRISSKLFDSSASDDPLAWHSDVRSRWKGTVKAIGFYTFSYDGDQDLTTDPFSMTFRIESGGKVDGYGVDYQDESELAVSGQMRDHLVHFRLNHPDEGDFGEGTGVILPFGLVGQWSDIDTSVLSGDFYFWIADVDEPCSPTKPVMVSSTAAQSALVFV